MFVRSPRKRIGWNIVMRASALPVDRTRSTVEQRKRNDAYFFASSRVRSCRHKKRRSALYSSNAAVLRLGKIAKSLRQTLWSSPPACRCRIWLFRRGIKPFFKRIKMIVRTLRRPRLLRCTSKCKDSPLTFEIFFYPALLSLTKTKDWTQQLLSAMISCLPDF